MTQRKFKSYTLWMKWRNLGWKPCVTVLNLPFPSDNPIYVLESWIKSKYYSWYNAVWVRGKTWMILPDDRKPKGWNDKN